MSFVREIVPWMNVITTDVNEANVDWIATVSGINGHHSECFIFPQIWSLGSLQYKLNDTLIFVPLPPHVESILTFSFNSCFFSTLATRRRINCISGQTSKNALHTRTYTLNINQCGYKKIAPCAQCTAYEEQFTKKQLNVHIIRHKHCFQIVCFALRSRCPLHCIASHRPAPMGFLYKWIAWLDVRTFYVYMTRRRWEDNTHTKKISFFRRKKSWYAAEIFSHS